MKGNEKDARKSIIASTMAILDEEPDHSRITVRGIAERAGVSIGLINYHFGSKERLLNEAVGMSMEQMAQEWVQGHTGETEPVDRLKSMLRHLAEYAVRYQTYTRISVQFELLHGNMETAQYLLPLLRRIFGNRKTEEELHIHGLQIITTLQMIFLRPETFLRYSGMNVMNQEGRNHLIDTLVDSIC